MLGGKLAHRLQESIEINVVLVETFTDYGHAVFESQRLGLQVENLSGNCIGGVNKFVYVVCTHLNSAARGAQVTLKFFVLSAERFCVGVENTNTALEVFNFVVENFIMLVDGHFEVDQATDGFHRFLVVLVV